LNYIFDPVLNSIASSR